jgi:hypothetical protein
MIKKNIYRLYNNTNNKFEHMYIHLVMRIIKTSLKFLEVLDILK